MPSTSGSSMNSSLVIRRPCAERIIRFASSQSSANGLFALDCLKERLEVSLAETARAAALDDFEEQRWPVRDRFGENLQHVALIVAIDENAKLGQRFHVFLNRADASRQGVVVTLRHAQERHVV